MRFSGARRISRYLDWFSAGWTVVETIKTYGLISTIAFGRANGRGEWAGRGIEEKKRKKKLPDF